MGQAAVNSGPDHAERQRYQRLPAAIAERDLRQHFHLSEADRASVAIFRGATSRLGMALHLGLLRYVGYLPDAWAMSVPAELRAFEAGQLADLALVDLAGYAVGRPCAWPTCRRPSST